MQKKTMGGWRRNLWQWRRETGMRQRSGEYQLYPMNIVTYNVRGLGRGVKWAAIRRLIKKENVDMICIQETKKEIIEKTMCQALWGDPAVSWEMQPAVNLAGGLLCM